MSAQPPPPPPPAGTPPPAPGTPPPPPPPLRPPPPYIPSSQLRPSQLWFVVAGVIGVVCVVLSVVLFISLFSGLVDDLTGPLTEFDAPGEVTVQLEAGADRTIYRKVRDSGTPVGTGAPDPQCTVTSDTGAQVEVGDTFEWTLKRSGDRFEAIADFSAADSGEYGVSCLTRGGAGEPVPVAIGESIAFWDLLRKGGIALALFFGGLIIAGGIAIATAVMRDSHKKKLQREALQQSTAGPTQ